MRSAVRWALGLTLAASAAALWWPKARLPLVAAVDRAAQAQVAAPQGAGHAGAGPAATTASWPAALEPLVLDPARRDPFVAPAPSPPPTPPAPRDVPATRAPLAVFSPPPAPAPPPLNVRFLGRMIRPDGRDLVLLTRGDDAVPVEAGTTLNEGYVVQRVTAGAVVLVYPGLGAPIEVPIPPSPQDLPAR
jgi:hypothetical protein